MNGQGWAGKMVLGIAVVAGLVGMVPVAAQAARTQAAAPASGPVVVPVYLLIYGAELADVLPITEQIMAHLERGTRYHGDGVAYVDFEVAASGIAKQATVPVQPGTFYADYAAIYSDNGVVDLCTWARRTPRGQIWVWEAGTGGTMAETVDNGPEWQNLHGTNVPDCGVQVTTFSHNYTRAVAYAIENHIHRYEQYFSAHYISAFNKSSGIPYQAPGAQCRGTAAGDGWGWCVEDFVAGHYGVVDASPQGFTGGARNRNDIAQCGWAHYPPNITWSYRQSQGDASRYVYDYQGTVLSNCRTWRLDQDPALTAEEISCTAWGCDRPGNDNQSEYFVWWMQNVPGPSNVNYDENGEPMENWWAGVF